MATIMKVCKRHGRTEFHIYPSRVGKNDRTGAKCKKCEVERASETRRRYKRKLVEMFGGCCQICGYDRCDAALQFHHVDRDNKICGVANRGSIRAFSKMVEEAEKCVLLCANCHAEVEVGVATLARGLTA